MSYTSPRIGKPGGCPPSSLLWPIPSSKCTTRSTSSAARNGTHTRSHSTSPWRIPQILFSTFRLSELGGMDSGIPQRYHVSNAKKFQGGIFNKADLSPDLVVLHEKCGNNPTGVHWANALHILEVKPQGTAICDGRNMPRLVVNGEHATDRFRVIRI